MKKVSDGGFLPTPSNPFQWLITLTASDLQALTGLNLVGFSCQQWMPFSLSSGLKSALCHVKEHRQSVILPMVHGKQEGYIHAWRSCHPRACLGEQQDHAENLLGFFVYFYLLKDYAVLAGLIHVHTRSDTQEMLCKRCSSLCPTPVLSHHRPAHSYFPPITFWSPLQVAEVSPFHPHAS